jgi:hypothetical protein
MADTKLPIAVMAYPTAEMVRVIEHGHSQSDTDLVSVKLGEPDAELALLGTLHQLQLVVAEAAPGLVVLENARRGEVHYDLAADDEEGER